MLLLGSETVTGTSLMQKISNFFSWAPHQDWLQSDKSGSILHLALAVPFFKGVKMKCSCSFC